MTQSTELEAIKARHEEAHEGWKVGNWFPDDGDKAHADRATLITLVEAERARADKAEAELARFVQIGWSNEHQIGYISTDGEGFVYSDPEDSEVPIFCALARAVKGEG
jgi:hypothetical protein